MAGETIMLVAYGIQVKPINDPYITTVEKANEATRVAAVPGRFLVDTLPWLKYVPEWVPGAGFQKVGREGKELAVKMINMPYEAAKKNIVRSKIIVLCAIL